LRWQAQIVAILAGRSIAEGLHCC